VRLGQKNDISLQFLVSLMAREPGKARAAKPRAGAAGKPGKARAHRKVGKASHTLLNRRVRRSFKNRKDVDGTVVSWQPPSADGAALFRVVHDDGDVEDLYERQGRCAATIHATVMSTDPFGACVSLLPIGSSNCCQQI
jgi:hypothetical protein